MIEGKFMIKKVLIPILIIFSFVSLNAKINIKSIGSDIATISLSNFKVNKSILLVLKRNSVMLVNPSGTIKLVKKSSINISSLKQYAPASYIVFYGDNANTELNIRGLKPATKYNLLAFKKDVENKGKYIQIDDNSFTTLAKEPKTQAKWIIFKNMKTKQITMFFKQGDGKKRIVVVSKGEKVDFPKDGINYKANNNYGSMKSKIGSKSYAVYNGDKNEVTIKDLEYGEYTFRVFEYNGKGESTNYLLEKSGQNPRTKWMPLPPPVALKAIEVTKTGFTAKWEKVKGAQYYELDIAKDKNFTQFIQFFNRMDVGNIDEMEVVELQKGDYYYRLRAVGERTRSEYSNVISVSIK